MPTKTDIHPETVLLDFLKAKGLDEWTADRVLVIGSARLRLCTPGHPFIDFEIDEKRGGHWFRVTYSLMLDDNNKGDTLIAESNSGRPHSQFSSMLTVGMDLVNAYLYENKCNGYDLAFLAWFQRHGWQIHQTPSGIAVWTKGDATCPFKYTRGMIERLEWNDHIERIFPRDAAPLDYVWILKQR